MPSLSHPTVLALVRDDLRLTTWILLGACLQLLMIVFLPTRVACVPAALLMSFRVLKVLLMLGGILHDPSLDKVAQGRLTAQFPSNSESGLSVHPEREEFVVFIIGARSNHQLSRFAPAFLQAGEHFEAMWREAEADRERWGYLGRTSDMLATDEETGNAIITLSYWRSMEHLNAFARSPAHLAGWEWFEKMTKIHAHLSFMHEVYAMPQGCWENIYRNMPPFGMGQIQHLTKSNASERGADSQGLISGLVPAMGSKQRIKSALRPAAASSHS